MKTIIFIAILVILSFTVLALPQVPNKPSFSIDSKGNVQFVDHCSNKVQDFDESGKDCGGSCGRCSIFNWIYILIPVSFLAAVVLFMVVMKSRISSKQQMQVSRPPQQQIKQPLQQESQQQSALQGYINLNLQKGYSEGQLREALLKQGWKKELIDKAFEGLKK